jgi:hypothetical protein
VCDSGRPGGESYHSPFLAVRAAQSTGPADLDDAPATKFLMHPLFSCCTNWPRLENGKGIQRAASVSAASVATAEDLGDEKGGGPPVKRPDGELLAYTGHRAGLAGRPRCKNSHLQAMRDQIRVLIHVCEI